MSSQSQRSTTSETATWLIDARKSRGFTQEKAADDAGIDQGLVSKIERGHQPRKDTIERLAAALTPPGADDKTRQSLLNAGLLAAGFAPAGMDMQHDLTPTERAVIDSFRIADPTLQEAAQRVLGVQRQSQQVTPIPKRQAQTQYTTRRDRDDDEAYALAASDNDRSLNDAQRAEVERNEEEERQGGRRGPKEPKGN